MTDGTDDVIEDIARELRALPAVDSAAKARLLVAVAAERERDRQGAARGHGRRRAAWLAGSLALAAAVAVGAVRLRQPAVVALSASEGPVRAAPSLRSGRPLAEPVSAESAQAGTARLASSAPSADASSAPQSVQLVFRAPAASRVRVVGDFNAWDAQRAPMTRDGESGLWSITLSVRPGRHVYAFVVDDTLWARDPRAPAAPDADFGRPGSVMLVGRP
jgi:hypothetical protein